MKYIFSINTGRVGSQYLSQLLSYTEECESYHEAYPNFASDPIRLVNTFGPENTLDFQRIKIRYILETPILKSVYADTSHLFIKSWYYAAVKDLRDITVIWLRRIKRDVVNSLMRLKSIPDKTLVAKNWYLKTNYPYNLVPVPNKISDRQRCEWYVKEIDARAKNFSKKYPHVPFIEVWLEDLNNSKYVHGLLEQLALTPTQKIEEIIGTKQNLKLPKKRSFIWKAKQRMKINCIRINPFKNWNRIHIDGDGVY